jgi:hypothetical protein
VLTIIEYDPVTIPSGFTLHHQTVRPKVAGRFHKATQLDSIAGEAENIKNA